MNQLQIALIEYEESEKDIEALEVFITQSGASCLAEELAELVDSGVIDVYDQE